MVQLLVLAFSLPQGPRFDQWSETNILQAVQLIQKETKSTYFYVLDTSYLFYIHYIAKVLDLIFSNRDRIKNDLNKKVFYFSCIKCE